MSYSRYLLAFIALGSLAGCASEIGDEADGENIGTAEQPLVYANVFNTGGDAINVRQGPNTTSAIVGTVSEGQSLGISCQVNGTSVLGTTIWDFIPAKSGYVTDAYMYTGYDGFVPGMPICGVTPPPPPTNLGAAIVAKGRTYLGYESGAGDCNQFSTWVGSGCQAWCGDYVRYIWGQSGARTTYLTGNSESFRIYGINFGTWKAATSTAVPKVGDAVVWGNSSYWAHVAIISAVSGTTFKILHGNYDNDGDGRGEVFETGYVNYTNQAGTGYPMAGFATPIP